MPVWQWLLDSAGAVLLVIILFGLVLVVRLTGALLKRWHLRAQLPRRRPGRGTWLGAGHGPLPPGNRPERFIIFYSLPGPRRTWRRNDLK